MELRTPVSVCATCNLNFFYAFFPRMRSEGLLLLRRPLAGGPCSRRVVASDRSCSRIFACAVPLGGCEQRLQAAPSRGSAKELEKDCE